jgi:hypothetical protein
MHYVTHKCYWKQKHKFSVTCPGVIFTENASGPPELQKKCVDVLRPGRTGVHYVTRRSHQMQKHVFGGLFVESVPVPSEHEKQGIDISRRGHTEMHYTLSHLLWSLPCLVWL